MAIPNSFMTLREAPDRYGVDIQSLLPKPQAYRICDCGEMIYFGEDYYDFRGTLVCGRCLKDYLNDHKKVAE